MENKHIPSLEEIRAKIALKWPLNAKQEKALAIAGTIIDLAGVIMQSSKNSPYRKKIFPTYERTPKRRLMKQRFRAMLIMQIAIARAQILIQMATPIPKADFKPGGVAMVGEQGPEVVMDFNNGNSKTVLFCVGRNHSKGFLTAQWLEKMKKSPKSE